MTSPAPPRTPAFPHSSTYPTYPNHRSHIALAAPPLHTADAPVTTPLYSPRRSPYL